MYRAEHSVISNRSFFWPMKQACLLAYETDIFWAMKQACLLGYETDLSSGL
jgi:hypothetical protein